MGKLKRRNNKKARVNPLSRPGQTDNGTNSKHDAKKDENTRQTKILPLLTKLKSSTPNDKSMAVGAITVLCEDERMRKMLLKEKLVSIILEECLNDPNDEIVVESFGLLRNLGIEEGLDVLKHYWRSDIWKHISGGLAKVETSFKYLAENGLQKDKSKVQLLYDFTENLLSLIMVLAGGSNELYDAIYTKIRPVLTLITHLIKNQADANSGLRITTKLFNSLLEFIYEFSTESREFLELLHSEYKFDVNALEQYVAQNQAQYNMLTFIYLEGIKFNIVESLDEQTEKNQISQEVLDKIYHTIGHVDVEEVKNNILSMNDAPKKDITVDDMTKEGNTRAETKMKLNSLEVSLDLITSILEYLGTSEEPVQLSPQILQTLLDKTYQILIELLKFEIINNSILLLTSKLLTSLNNLVWLMVSTENLPVEWFNKCQEIWELIIQSSKSEDLEIQKSCLNILWGVSKCMGAEAKTEPAMVESLVSKGEEIRVSLVKTAQNEGSKALDDSTLEFYLTLVGFLGSMAQVVNNTPLTGRISQFLVESIDSLRTIDNPIAFEIVLEGLNHIYDIFSDKEFAYDQEVFVQQGYLIKLKALEPHMKALYKRIDKNKYGQLKVRAEEAWINLGRFIQYKETE